jgi:hypothetical protein
MVDVEPPTDAIGMAKRTLIPVHSVRRRSKLWITCLSTVSSVQRHGSELSGKFFSLISPWIVPCLLLLGGAPPESCSLKADEKVWCLCLFGHLVNLEGVQSTCSQQGGLNAGNPQWSQDLGACGLPPDCSPPRHPAFEAFVALFLGHDFVIFFSLYPLLSLSPGLGNLLDPCMTLFSFLLMKKRANIL